MRKKISNVSRLIVPNKKINIFVISILILGVITGSIFMTIINKLPQVINNMRNKIIELGGEFYFNTRATELLGSNASVTGVRTINVHTNEEKIFIYFIR